MLANLLAPSAPPPVAPAISAPAAEPPKAAFPPVPETLPKIPARTAAAICKECKPGSAALALLTPEQTPAQFLSLLQERQMAEAMVKVLAQGLPDREGVAWAVQCVLKVAEKLPPADLNALKAAQAWVKEPTLQRQKAAAIAAERTDFQGPGAWAAQAAAYAQGGGLRPASPAGPIPPRLTPHAVGGAVALAISVVASPEYAARLLPAMKAIAIGAVAGMSVAGVNAARLAGAPSQIQAPPLGIPGAPAVSGVGMPQLPGAMGGAQAGIGALPVLGAMAAGGANLASVSGVAASAALPQSAAAGAALGGIGALPSAIGGSAPNLQIPGVANPGLPSLSSPGAPGMSPPNPPSVAPAIPFGDQQPFIGIGLEIAGGQRAVA